MRNRSEVYRVRKLVPLVAKQPEVKIDDDEPVVYRSNLTVLTEVDIIVPQDIVDVCTAMQIKFDDHEFSILAKGEWTPRGFVVGKEYVIPKQRVGYASVDYDREDLTRLKQIGYNTVIHAHPYSGIRANRDKAHQSRFSKDDEDTINKHFRCSILYCGGTLDDARVTIDISPETKLKLAASDIVIERIPNVTLPEGVDALVEKVVPAPRYRTLVEEDDADENAKYPMYGFGRFSRGNFNFDIDAAMDEAFCGFSRGRGDNL